MRLTVTHPVRDEGSIVVLAGINDDGASVTFGCDYRMADAILEALQQGEDVSVEIEPWQIIGGVIAL